MKKKLLAILLVSLLLVTCLCACNKDKNVEDDDTIKIFVGLGNQKAYYEAIADLIAEKLPDTKIQFVYQNSYDTSTSIRLEFKNNDLPADIMITASKCPDEYLKDSCLDYQKYTHITKYFSLGKITECTADDGGVYQLPFTSRLIGVTYNKTLMEEMGWSVPTSFAEMKALKKQCEDAGYQFAVSDGCLSGHGFNWFFHLMGSEWISSIDGTEWIEEFVAGDTDVTALSEEAQYFKEYYEAGLFGDLYTTSYAKTTFQEQRVLFYYNLINDTYSYSGVQKNSSGDEIGTLNDTYASMPWISKDKGSNSFTSYDNMFLMLNKNLANNQTKFDKVLKILELWTSDEAIDIYTNMYADGYIAVNSFEPSDNCMFKAYIDDINSGLTQPWYYNYFDNDTIVNVGTKVNDYLNGGTSTYNDIISELQRNVSAYATGSTPDSGITIDNTLSYNDVAKLNAIAGAVVANQLLATEGVNAEVTVSLMAYVNNVEDYAPFINHLNVANTKLYAGKLDAVTVKTIIKSHAHRVVAVRLTGAEINDIISKGYDGSADFKYDASKYGPYPIIAMTKGGFQIDNNATYVVAMNKEFIGTETLQKYTEEGKVLTTTVPSTIEPFETALVTYLKGLGHVSSNNISWN